MLFSTLRFLVNGWVETQYLEPTFHFKYFGFEWVEVAPPAILYGIFAVMALSAFLIMIGAFYQISTASFFLTFTYIELLDKTWYLNHYYLVTILSFLLIWVPAHRHFSVDAWRNPKIRRERVPRWVIGIFRLQIGMVYFFAGVAKINPDWLLRALPLKIWLPAKSGLPIFGSLLKLKWVAFVFSWFGCLFDLSIPFLMNMRRTRTFAYALVLIFHIATWLLFPIGVFPFMMMGLTLIFFPPAIHQKIQSKITAWLGNFIRPKNKPQPIHSQQKSPGFTALKYFIGAWFIIQAILPFRHMLYPGKLFWTEQGYRFSWRVMLMEKAGYAIFEVENPETGGVSEISNSDYLTFYQEKMMSTQPDMILQFAHFLESEYQKQGIDNPEVRAKVYVTLNGTGSRPYIDPTVNLAMVRDGYHHKSWILPWHD